MGHVKVLKLATGFTLVELLVVISIIALLVSILLPALAQARDAALLAKCGSNMRQQGIAMYGYMSDSRDYVPYAAWWHTDYSWDDLIDPYLGAVRSSAELSAQHLDASIGNEILVCARDPMRENPYPAGRAVRSYSMPRAADGDVVQGVAAFSTGGVDEPPRQYRIGDVPAASGTFLVVERSAAPFSATSTNLQGGQWFAEMDVPRQQMPEAAYFDLDASASGRGKLIHGSMSRPLFNYLYCDGHVRVWTPVQTLGTAATLDGPARGPWTRASND